MSRSALLLAVFLVSGFAWRVNSSRQAQGSAIDFYQFWTIGKTPTEARAADLYSRETQKSIAAFAKTESARSPQLAGLIAKRPLPDITNSPFLYALAGWTLPSRFDRAYQLHAAASLLALMLAVAAICALASASLETAGLALVLAFLIHDAVASDVRAGNVMELQAASLVGTAFLARRGRDGLAGALLGVATLFKPTLLAVAPLLAVARLASGERKRLMRSLAGFSAAALISVAAGAARYGLRSWPDWIRSLSELASNTYEVRSGNFALSELLVERGIHLPVAGVWLGLLALAAAAIRSGRGADDLATISLAIAATLLAPRLVWLHYWVLLFPGQLWLCFAGASRGTRLAGAASLLCTAVHPASAILGVSHPLLAPAEMIGAAAIVYGAFLWEVAHPSRSAEGAIAAAAASRLRTTA